MSIRARRWFFVGAGGCWITCRPGYSHDETTQRGFNGHAERSTTVRESHDKSAYNDSNKEDNDTDSDAAAAAADGDIMLVLVVAG